ncbi:MAG: hypothetical protein ACREIJ_03835 [Nitrospiraceae bacterium]
MPESVSRYGKEFQEIGHCGGQITVEIKTDENGHRGIAFGFRHSRPTPAAFFAVYALPEGLPVGTIQLGGIGQPWNPAPLPNCLPIFIGSDSLGMYGHQCTKCKGYWRSRGAPSRWRMTCPYCGLRAECHAFVTDGQRKYIRACVDLALRAMESDHDGEHLIDMDQVADAVGKEGLKPEFYYAEETQQNQYTCFTCGDVNDILGRYGYCSTCGTHNGLSELEKEILGIKDRMNREQQYEVCVKDAVSAFDSYARQIAKQMASRIPMTLGRRKEWENKLFHNLKPRAEEFKTVFDINLFTGLTQDDIDFATLMFHRRHVYEHNGGEVDERYVRQSGDTSVRIKQAIRESRETALRISDLVVKIARNLLNGFHQIFPPEELPLEFESGRKQRLGS